MVNHTIPGRCGALYYLGRTTDRPLSAMTIDCLSESNSEHHFMDALVEKSRAIPKGILLKCLWELKSMTDMYKLLHI